MENNIKAWRESRGLTQQQVADIFRVKYGKSTITLQHISFFGNDNKWPLHFKMG